MLYKFALRDNNVGNYMNLLKLEAIQQYDDETFFFFWLTFINHHAVVTNVVRLSVTLFVYVGVLQCIH